ncbi:MAG: fused MFS/spermidine synthase [Planctomycetota bacterium]
MSKSRNPAEGGPDQTQRCWVSILIPSATVFVSSFCIMVLELVAARLVAKHLGSSLYTWTAVIGVVLAGITIGNYLGGRIADRFRAPKALAVLFAFSSAACVIVVILNNLVGEWIWLWRFSWPMRVFAHVSLVFLIPSILLGTISPVVTKMALDRGLPTGRTVGDIYAWGAAGSIAGTFATGYYLILAMGTISIIWSVGGVLLLLAILYWARLWVLYLWAAIFIALMTMAMAPADWVKGAGAGLALRERPNPNIIYEDESQYCYIAVKSISKNPDRRVFMQDKLKHSDMVMGDILDLKYSYAQIYAAVTHLLSQDKSKLSVLVIGGGGYVFPRYIEEVWPGSRIDVVEIDPGVTEAAMQAFGLKPDTPINTFTMDARVYVNQLLGQKTRYDFIYEDALSDYSIPYQLTTKEFNDKIARILTDSGVYMIELIDIYDSGLFIGAFVNTLEQTFSHVYVVTEEQSRSGRSTFVVIATKQEINLENLRLEKPVKNLDLWILSGACLEALKGKARGGTPLHGNRIVLTDDYAPVENLLAPVVLQSAIDLLTEKYRTQAEELERSGKPDQSIAKYKDIISADPTLSTGAYSYSKIGAILAGQGKLEEAMDAFKSALEYNDRAEFKQSMSNVHYNMGVVLQRLGSNDEAFEYMQKAVQGYRKDLAKTPDSAKTVSRLGNALAGVGNFSEATGYFQQAVNLNPYDTKNHSTLAQALIIQERYDEASKQNK